MKDRVTQALLVLGGALSTTAFLLAFFWAPATLMPDGVRVNFGQKIFYFHVPVAEISFGAIIVAAVFSVMFLMKREKRYDTKARTAMEITLVFVILTMATGILGTRFEWGVWWLWEARLTTYFIMTLLVIGYFVLRNSVEDEERRAVYAAVFGIVAAIDAPISFGITRWYESNHPVVFAGGEGSGLEPPMLVTFIIAQIGMLMLGYVFYQIRIRENLARERLEALKSALEES